MTAPACVPCKQVMVPDEIGVSVVREERLTSAFWRADRFRCRCCGAQVYAGWGNMPIVWSDDHRFEEYVEAEKPVVVRER